MSFFFVTFSKWISPWEGRQSCTQLLGITEHILRNKHTHAHTALDKILWSDLRAGTNRNLFIQQFFKSIAWGLKISRSIKQHTQAASLNVLHQYGIATFKSPKENLTKYPSTRLADEGAHQKWQGAHSLLPSADYVREWHPAIVRGVKLVFSSGRKGHVNNFYNRCHGWTGTDCDGSNVCRLLTNATPPTPPPHPIGMGGVKQVWLWPTGRCNWDVANGSRGRTRRLKVPVHFRHFNAPVALDKGSKWWVRFFRFRCVDGKELFSPFTWFTCCRRAAPIPPAHHFRYSRGLYTACPTILNSWQLTIFVCRLGRVTLLYVIHFKTFAASSSSVGDAAKQVLPLLSHLVLICLWADIRAAVTELE